MRRWIGYVAIILWWSRMARSLSSLHRGYKISPKPCRVPGVDGVEGTCMFVWECIKSEGSHVGVCVDTFMFGTCCVVNATNNYISTNSQNGTTSELTRLTVQNQSGLSTSHQEEASSMIRFNLTDILSHSSMKPVKSVLSESSSRPLQKRPNNSQENRLQNSSDVSFWDKNIQGTRTPEHAEFQPHQINKVDKFHHNNLKVRQPSKNHIPIKAQHHKPYRPEYNSHNDTQIDDMTGQATIHRPNVNSIQDNEKTSIMGHNGIHTERPSWATKPLHSDKLSTDIHKTALFVKTTTSSPISSISNTNARPNFISKPNNKPGKITTAKPCKNNSHSTSTAGSDLQESHWHVTTEPAFITKNKPSTGTPSSIFHTTSHSNSFHWSENSWTPPKPSIKPHWTDNPNLLQNGPENFPQHSNFDESISNENAEYLDKPLTASELISSLAENSGMKKKKPLSESTTASSASTTDVVTTLSSTSVTQAEVSEASSTGSVMTIAASAKSENMQCGVPSLFPVPEMRIVGGKNAPFGRWPWQVSVRRTSFFGFSSTHRCGGAILNENWIATAGHCVDDLLISQIRIRVGEYDFSSVSERLPYVERGIKKKIVHPEYNFFTFEYDLALVRLETPLSLTSHISPICLPASDELLTGQNATVTGWGRLSEGGTLPSVLQEVSVPIVSNDRCKSMFLRAGRHEFIPDIFLCAGYETGGQDSCQGDSGGPLQVRGKDGRYFLAGIISWGIGCAEANLPGVCTRISKFVPWILKHVT